MKPSKGRVFCLECRRHKLLFDSEKKAELFIKFNADEIEESSGYVPVRSYYCIACGGWHVTHKPLVHAKKSVSERIVEDYNCAILREMSAKEKVAIKRREIHKSNLERIAEINSMIEEIRKCIELASYDEARTVLLEAYKILQSIWTTVGDKAAKKRIHKELDYFAESLKVQPVRIHE